jgi:hypothetical protein
VPAVNNLNRPDKTGPLARQGHENEALPWFRNSAPGVKETAKRQRNLIQINAFPRDSFTLA